MRHGLAEGSAEAGATTTEFAVVYALLLGMVLVAMHFGFVFHASLAVGDAADAALEAFQAEGGTAADARSAAAMIIGGDPLVDSVSVSISSDAEIVTIEVSASSPSLAPGLPNHVSRIASGPVERFIPEPER